MIPAWIDISLVAIAIATATAYLIIRKIRSARRISRDWTTGRAEVCNSCPVIQIRRAQNIQ